MIKIKHSFACYKTKKGEVICKVKEVAVIIKNYGNIPERLNDLRAQEISMVAEDYLHMRKSAEKTIRKHKVKK